ncbi:CYTH and CHAD domain-containing protein [Mangrovihabitans endophyticus]|uniref:CHAD domain-containing protein n=1 Tax=Mangrovihabitans endophyticus TaxID=1751298 RepID=A0A8J3C407_9ACTN|nr:CYTH and CHAD domain-containing protein [Mangrovihabitans endophyticus]GGL07126.1 CHAD domain-containing protein [Mangrovihabitans endophyticus]
MQTATETERKYDVPDGFDLPALDDAGTPRVHDLDAIYYDTDDLRLARHRRTLRRRSGGTDAGWHLKTPGDGTGRTEHQMPPDGDSVPGELRAVVRALVRTSELRPVARLQTHRVETPLHDARGRTLALIAQDEVTATVDDRVWRWRELEVELVDGDVALLERVESLLLRAGARPASGPSKLARALGDKLTPAPSARIKDPALRYAREQRDAIVAHDPGVRAGDPEAVHKMRVATRRLRSVLKTYRKSFRAEPSAHVRAELKWLAEKLGTVRDAQVMQRKLLSVVERETDEVAAIAERIREHLGEAERCGRRELGTALDGERYLTLLDAIDDLVAGPDRPHGDPRRRADKALRTADRELDEARLTLDDAALHGARKSYKRARYAIEVMVPDQGRRAKQLADAVSRLQDVLGAHQDAVVARELLRELASQAADGFPYGVAYARQEQAGQDALGQLPVTLEDVRRRKLRDWLT